MTPVRYPVIVLAAGMSRRMGQTKALLELGGQPMIIRVVETCTSCNAIDKVIVVIGYDASRIEEALATHKVSLVRNSDYETGEMLSSVQTGVRALPKDCDAFFLLPGDQPFVTASTFTDLANHFQEAEASVVLPVYKGKRGHPVLISRLLVPEILMLGAGDSLKTALIPHRSRTFEIAVPDPGTILDLDTPGDYTAALTTNRDLV